MGERHAVALVLHGHLPHAGNERTPDRMAERWLLEALWECYLPLCGLLDRLADEGRPVTLSLSLSPSLVSMLRWRSLPALLDAHLAHLEELNARPSLAAAHAPEGVPRELYVRLLGAIREQWRRMDGDLLGALLRHRAEGRLELLTTSASHAYLPGLRGCDDAAWMQLELGLRSFAKQCGLRPTGLWLPECAFVPELDPLLARAGIGYTVLDAHGLELAQPAPPSGFRRPVLGDSGVAYFGRDRAASHRVWSRAHGYPGDGCYREFYRDLGFELSETELGPLGGRLPTGLKYWRISREQGASVPYDPLAAAARAHEHAADFVRHCEDTLLPTAPQGSAPILVAAYDAELFGHWWFEGPPFLEAVLRTLATHAGLRPVRLGEYLAEHPVCPRAEPAASSWGQGGHGEVWVGPRTAFLWRHVRDTHRLVRDAVRTRQAASRVSARAVDQAIRESVLLQASDWAFMVHGGTLADHALYRAREHAQAARRLVTLASATEPSELEVAWLAEREAPGSLLGELCGAELRDVLQDGHPGL